MSYPTRTFNKVIRKEIGQGLEASTANIAGTGNERDLIDGDNDLELQDIQEPSTRITLCNIMYVKANLLEDITAMQERRPM